MRISAFATVSIVMLAGLFSNFAPGLADHTESNFAGNSSGTEAISELTESSFQNQVLKSKQPVFVDFYATWCEPCKLLSPIVDGLAKQYVGKVTFYRVDVDKNKKLVGKLNITAMPTCKLFKKGKQIDETIGLVSAGELREKIDKAL